MMKLDIDGFTERSRYELQLILYAMPRPFAVRLSASRSGLHIAVPKCQEWDYRRFIYDDKMRINLDDQRRRAYIPVKNLLWDTKNGTPAGHWQLMTSEHNIEQFLDAIETLIIYSERAYRDVCQPC